MKKLIILSVLLFIVMGSSAQCNLPYKPLSEFGNDTTAFVLYNFMDRADQYKGKTLKEVEKDLQIPIKHIAETSDGNKDYIIGLIYIYDKEKVFHLLNDKDIDFYSIGVYWEKPIGSVVKLNYLADLKAIYNTCKDYEIKKIRVTLSPYYKDYEKYYPHKGTKSATGDIESKRFPYKWKGK
ncbi:MAG: hypothetical protein ACK5M3_18295 [Dysgonomonas sp.]